jgi:transposase
MIDRPDAELDPLDAQLLRFARRQPGCRALLRRYGVGALTAAAILAERGDAAGSPAPAGRCGSPAWM